MRQSKKIRFYLNIFNFIPVIIVIITGLVLQIEYHMHRLPDEFLVSGLSRDGWLLFHKISAITALSGITFHCMFHRKFLAETTRKIVNSKPVLKIVSSYYLFIICIPTCLTAFASWIFFSRGDNTRHILLEIHDKLALFIIIFIYIHIASRFKSLIKTYRFLKNSPQ